jgi:disulfide bond formation protein DsbB
MILGLEIGLAIIGLIALFGGKFTISKTKVVEGVPARLLGLLALTPFPLAFVVVVGYVAANAPANPEQFVADNQWTIIGIEAAIVITIAVLLFVISAAVATNPEARKRRDEDEGRTWDRG